MTHPLKTSDSIQALLDELNHRLDNGHYNDAVHKIKLLTTKEVVERMIAE